MKFITAMIASLVLSTSVYAQEISREDKCMILAYNIIEPLAKVRDQGLPPKDAVLVLIGAGIDTQSAIDMVSFVYYGRPNSPPAEIGNEVLNQCLGEPA